jgi:ABC-2 type transport system ATP-binding protein
LFSSHQLDLVQDICEDVVIIDHGRIVLAGDLNELRAAVPERVVDIRYHGPPPVWSQVTSAEIVEAGDGHARLRICQKVDPGAVIASLGDSSRIVSFVYEPPTLSELFALAVAA